MFHSNTNILLHSAKDLGLEVNMDKTKYVIISVKGERLNGNDHLTVERDFEKVSEFRYLRA